MLINRTSCRQALLANANQRWPGKMTRVQNEIYAHLDTVIQTEIRNLIKMHPTVGHTVMISTKTRQKTITAKGLYEN